MSHNNYHRALFISAPKFNFLDHSNSGIGIYRIVFHGIEIRYRVGVLLHDSWIGGVRLIPSHQSHTDSPGETDDFSK